MNHKITTSSSNSEESYTSASDLDKPLSHAQSKAEKVSQKEKISTNHSQKLQELTTFRQFVEVHHQFLEIKKDQKCHALDQNLSNNSNLDILQQVLHQSKKCQNLALELLLEITRPRGSYGKPHNFNNIFSPRKQINLGDIKLISLDS